MTNLLDNWVELVKAGNIDRVRGTIVTCTNFPARKHKYSMSLTKEGYICAECEPEKYKAAITK